MDAADAGGLDRRGRAAARVALAGLRLATGDVGAVRALAGEAVADARASGDRELLPLVGELGDPWAVAHGRIVEAQLLLLRGEVGASAEALRAAEDIARGTGLPFTLATVLNMRATLALRSGDDDAALRHLTASAHLAAEVGTTWPLVYSLSALAGVAARHDEPELAASLFAAASATAEATLLAVSFRADADTADAQLEAVRRRLPAEEFRRAWEHGRALRAAEVLALISRISARRGPG